MYFSAGGVTQGGEVYRDILGDGSEKYFFPLAGHGSDILNRGHIRISGNQERYKTIAGELCVDFQITDNLYNYGYASPSIQRSSWEAISMSAKVRINASDDGRWLHIMGFGDIYMNFGKGQPGLWAYPNDKTKLYCSNDSQATDNNGTSSDSGALPHKEWFLLSVSIEPMRMRAWVGDKIIIDYVPNAIFSKNDNNLILSAYYHNAGFSIKDVRIFDKGFTYSDIQVLNNHFIETRKPFVKDDRYDTLGKDKTLRAYPLIESVNDVLSNKSLNPIGSPNEMQLYKGQLYTGNAQCRMTDLPVDETTEAITISGILYVLNGEYMVFGMNSHSLYSYNGGFGFHTAQGDVYGVSMSIVGNMWKHIIVTFKKGMYGDIFIDGIRQTLQHFAAIPDIVNPVLFPEIAMSGWLNDASYRAAAWYKELKVIAGTITDEEAMRLATEEWHSDRTIENFTPVDGVYIPCEKETPYSCIAKAAKMGSASFPVEHLVPDIDVIPYPLGHAKNLLWERMFALKNTTRTNAKAYSLDLSKVSASHTEMYNGELALIMSEDNIVDTGIIHSEFKAVHMRAYYDGVSVVGIGSDVHNRLHIRTSGKALYIQWRDGVESGARNYSSYTIPDELLNTWVDFIVSVNARGIQFDRVTANGSPLSWTMEADHDGTFCTKVFGGTAKIGVCQNSTSLIYSNGRVSKVDVYSEYLSQLNINNIVAGKEYNEGIPVYSDNPVLMMREGDKVYGLYNGVTILPVSEADSEVWFHNSIPGVIETAQMCCGIQKPMFPNFIKREYATIFSKNGYYVRNTSNEVLGGYKDRLCYPYWQGIYKTISGLPASSKVRVVMHVLLIDSLDQSNNDRFIVEVANKQLKISPSEGMHNQIESLDALIAIQPTILNTDETSTHNYGSGMGDTVASFAFDVDTDANGSVYARLRAYTTQYWNYGSLGLAAVDVYALEQDE